MKRSLRILLGMALLGLLISACSPVDYNLFGTWRNSENGSTLVFLNNGRFRSGSATNYQEIDFASTGPGEFTLSVPSQQGPLIDQKIYYTLQGYFLIILISDNPVVFKRVK